MDAETTTTTNNNNTDTTDTNTTNTHTTTPTTRPVTIEVDKGSSIVISETDSARPGKVLLTLRSVASTEEEAPDFDAPALDSVTASPANNETDTISLCSNASTAVSLHQVHDPADGLSVAPVLFECFLCKRYFPRTTLIPTDWYHTPGLVLRCRDEYKCKHRPFMCYGSQENCVNKERMAWDDIAYRPKHQYAKETYCRVCAPEGARIHAASDRQIELDELRWKIRDEKEAAARAERANRVPFWRRHQ